MPIAREGQFLITRTMGNVPHLGLESAQLTECIAEVKKSAWKGVFGSPLFGFRESTLDALRSLPWLESVWFWEIDLENIDALYELPALRSMGVSPRRPPIDHSRLPSLTNLTVHPIAKDCGIEQLMHLEVLSVWHFNPPHATFDDFLLPSGLKELEINWANVRSLAGLAPNPGVRRLEFHRCRNLESLAGLAGCFPNLEHLVISACGKVDPTREQDEIRRLPHLQHAYVQKRKLV
jgi:hypothetical protein